MDRQKKPRFSREIWLWMVAIVFTFLVLALVIYQFPYLLTNVSHSSAVTVISASENQ